MTPLSSSSHTIPVDSFEAAGALENALRAALKGEVRFDRGSRAAYASDASNYRQVPIGLVVPEDEADIIAAVAICRQHKAPIVARGAGTSLAGQACNTAVVFDFSKKFNQVVALDGKKRLARVQPGIVLDDLQAKAAPLGLMFAPDPSTHNRCTIGGMIGNNSSGAHGLLGGKVQDNVESMRVLLYDGTLLEVGPTPPERLTELIRSGGRIGQIYGGLARIRDTRSDLVRERYAKIPRRVSGFNFDELLPESPFNVARALVGTEGTCMIILEATLRLIPAPTEKLLVCLTYPDVFVAADDVPEILKFKPMALEGFEGAVLEVMRAKGLQAENIALLPKGGGFLLVEFGGTNKAEVLAEAERFIEWVKARPTAPVVMLVQDEAIARRIWKVREGGNGSTTVIPGQMATTHEGWEDAAVHPNVLGPYLRDYKALLAKHGYRAWYYGHFGEGVVHQRVTFDLETEAGVRAFRVFLEEAADLVVRYGGSISGEHGDGHARAFLYEKMFGPELVNAFREFKRLWDPDGGLNPGKVVDAYEPEAFLRYGSDYEVKPLKTHFHFPEDHGSLERATHRCVGVGACRKTDGGVMCPSFQVTKEEVHSTRGRAHLLFEMLQGEVLQDGWRDQATKESLDLCLACKGCKSECPTNVDIATYKSEFLSHYYEGRARPLEHYAFGYIDKWAKLAGIAPGLSNAIANFGPVRWVINQALRLEHSRILPHFAKESFASSLRRKPKQPASERRVVLFADTFNNYFRPATATAAWEVLAGAGFEVIVPQADEHLCCGRPLFDFGLLDSAKSYLLRVLDRLKPHLEAGLAIVMLEPSCASVFRDELCNLLPDHPLSKQLKAQTFALSEFLQRADVKYTPPNLEGHQLLVHGHCHHRSVLKFPEEEKLLRRTNAKMQVLDSGCCGMAGPFGFKEETFAVGQAVGERVLLPAVRAAKSDTAIVADGFSCREQIEQSTGRRTLHLAEILRGQAAPGSEAEAESETK